jgi:hypothetical protein
VTGQSDRGVFSVEIPFSQITVAYVKLTKKKKKKRKEKRKERKKNKKMTINHVLGAKKHIEKLY